MNWIQRRGTEGDKTQNDDGIEPNRRKTNAGVKGRQRETRLKIAAELDPVEKAQMETRVEKIIKSSGDWI